jgi:hypothetical protein
MRTKSLLAKRRNRKLSRLSTGLAVTICAVAATLAMAPATQAAEGAAGLSTTGKVDDVMSPETRSLLQLQQQLRETQMAVERNHKESAESAVQTTEALATSMKATTELAGRMKNLEESLSTQRSRELDVMQNSNRTMLIVAGVFATFGFVALFMMGYFQWRTVNRLAEISAVLPPAGLPLPSQRLRAALMTGESVVTASAPARTDNSDLLQTIAQLEKRIRELEHGTTTQAMNGHTETEEEAVTGTTFEENPGTQVQGNGTGEHKPAKETADSPEADRVTFLLGKGQSLLDLDKAEEALACFDEALSLEATNAEALVKKGAALERLRKLNEAIECYDRAIKADNTMTIAYLYKGGLCNRMERFNEALQCYEQALRTQEKRAA